MALSTAALSSLPQNDDIWYMSFPRLRFWIEEEDENGNEIFFRPYLIMIVHTNTGLSLKFQPVKDIPGLDEMKQILYSLMHYPLGEMPPDFRKELNYDLPPHRPAEIHLDDRKLPERLGPLLDEIGVPVIYKPQQKIVDEMIKDIVGNMGAGEDDMMGLLKVRGVSTQQIRMLFDAANEFYKAAPWRHLSNYDLLSVQVFPHKEPMYVVVMGEGGEEYGMSVSRNWEEVKSLYAEDPSDTLPKKGRHAFLYNRPPDISFDDIEAVEKYGWPLPEPDLYPTPSLFTPKEFRRPDAVMLRWYEAALRAIPLFVEKHLPEDYEMDQPPIEADLTVTTSAGKVKVKIRFPGVDPEKLEELFDLQELLDFDPLEDEEE
jgi:hypothetical protein